VTGGRRRKCAENQNISAITLALGEYSDSIGNNACHMILCRSYQAKHLDRSRMEKNTAWGWMQTCLEVITEHG